MIIFEARLVLIRRKLTKDPARPTDVLIQCMDTDTFKGGGCFQTRAGIRVALVKAQTLQQGPQPLPCLLCLTCHLAVHTAQQLWEKGMQVIMWLGPGVAGELTEEGYIIGQWWKATQVGQHSRCMGRGAMGGGIREGTSFCPGPLKTGNQPHFRQIIPPICISETVQFQSILLICCHSQTILQTGAIGSPILSWFFTPFPFLCDNCIIQILRHFHMVEHSHIIDAQSVTVIPSSQGTLEIVVLHWWSISEYQLAHHTTNPKHSFGEMMPIKAIPNWYKLLKYNFVQSCATRQGCPVI